MSKIKSIIARQIIDSRGNPTVEVDVVTSGGALGRAAVPSGASTGKHEAVELRDGRKEYLGKGVLKAVKNVNETIAKLLKNKEVGAQRVLDDLMIQADGTSNKRKLGANAILAVSLAAAKAAAIESKKSLFKYIGGAKAVKMPIPMMNVINGGVHADNKIDFQEFMIVPHKAKNFSESLRYGTEVFHHLKTLLKKNQYATNVGDEGGFAPNISSNEEAIETLLKAIEVAGYKPGTEISIALDAASSEMYEEETATYKFYKSSGKTMTREEMVAYWEKWVNAYPIVSIEDGMAEDDWEGWKLLTDRIGKKIQLVGDDLFVTNVERLKRGIQEKIANSILIKVNQIGSLSETIDTVKLAQKSGMTTVMSHRSGETEDVTIADLAVGLNCGQIKTGSLSRKDRTAKYNQLLRIEQELGKRAVFPKWATR